MNFTFKKSKLFSVLPLFFIVAFALALRLLWLDRIPIAIANDELDYILDAKAIFFSGKDLSGEWSPLSLVPPPHQVPKAELPSLIVSPLIGSMRLSLFSARLPYVLWGTVLIVVLYLIAQKLFDQKTAFIVGAIAAINPWSFYFSRTAFEAPLAVTFYFLAFYILISLKGWGLLFSFPFLFLAFFSYIGTKIIFLPFVLIVCFYSWFFVNKKRFTKQYLLLCLLSLGVFTWFVFSLRYQPAGTRVSGLLTPFHSVVVQRVNTERRLSVVNPLVRVFANKLVVFLKLFFERYLGAFSTDFLFLYGAKEGASSMWTHGVFYYLDLLFLALGFCSLFLKNRSLWLCLVALVAIAPLPSSFVAGGREYAFRAVLLYPVIILFISLGISFFISLKKTNYYCLGAVIVIGAIYFIHLLNFLNIYFFRNPIYNSEGFGLSQRVLINYVNRVKFDARKVLVVSSDNLNMFKRYLFYSDVLGRKELPFVHAAMAKDDYYWENVYFSSECPKRLTEGEVVIVLSIGDCLPKEKHPYYLSISQLSDGGEVNRIFNDPVCYHFALGRYPSGITLDDFKVEELSTERFCQKFISDLTGDADFRKKYFKVDN